MLEEKYKKKYIITSKDGGLFVLNWGISDFGYPFRDFNKYSALIIGTIANKELPISGT